jgi:hypothetical protein
VDRLTRRRALVKSETMTASVASNDPTISLSAAIRTKISALRVEIHT